MELNNHIIKQVKEHTELQSSDSIHSYLTFNPDITFMKCVYRRYTKFINGTIPIKITNIENQNIHCELSSRIKTIGANFINNIFIDIKKQYPVESITIYFNNNYEFYHIDLLKFLLYLGLNTIIDNDDSFIITIPYCNAITLENSLYFEINFQNQHPDSIDLLLYVSKLNKNDINLLQITTGNKSKKVL